MPGCVKQTDPSLIVPISASAAIEVRDASKNYGSLTAVDQASFTVHSQTICGLVGSDGAGKTTLLRMIATMIKPSAGRILIGGLDLLRHRSKVKNLMGYMPQRFGLYPDLTVDENLAFFMDIFGIYGQERARRRETYLGFSNLLPFIDRPARDLSGGMKQKLGLACVLVNQPRMLILDEPTNGVDPVSRQEFWEILGRMKQEGITILVSTAYLDEGEKCDQLLLMHQARIIGNTTPHEMRADFSDLEEALIHRIQEVDDALVADRFNA
ncbi:MAG: ABC transporter ATP-binding protein [Proteobacteria bacterium]|nr:ABC transporter ATP-binding protein [Pseudomonadota bacterium]